MKRCIVPMKLSKRLTCCPLSPLPGNCHNGAGCRADHSASILAFHWHWKILLVLSTLSSVQCMMRGHVSKQAVWTASILIAAPVSLHRQWINIPTAHVEVLAGAAAVGSVFAELFMIKSLLVFDPTVPVENSTGPTSPRYKRSRVKPHSCIRSGQDDVFAASVGVSSEMAVLLLYKAVVWVLFAADEAFGFNRCCGDGPAVGNNGRRDAARH